MTVHQIKATLATLSWLTLSACAEPAEVQTSPAPDAGPDLLSPDLRDELDLGRLSDLREADLSQDVDMASPDDMGDMSAVSDMSGAALKGLRASICQGADLSGALTPLPSPKVIAQAGTLEDQSSRAFNFLEGPVWDAKRQRLYFTDMNNATPNKALSDDMSGPPSIIYALNPTDSTVSVLSPEGQLRSNGLAIDEQGRLVAAAHDQRQIAALDLDTMMRSALVADYQGKSFNTINDLVLSSANTVYFTDPAYNGQLDGRARDLEFEGVFMARQDGQAILIDDRINRPNGITISPDESWLYVASRGDNKVYRYPLDAQGNPGEREVFLEGPSPDGVAIDCAGNLYFALPGKGVDVFDAQGKSLGRMANTKNVTNVAFGGPEHRTLYITEQKALKAADMPIKGMPY